MPDVQPNERSDWIESLYRLYSRELWAIFYAHCSDRERALDAVQEAFLRLQKHQGPAIQDPRAWILRVGHNWLRDVARRQRRAAVGTDQLDQVREDRLNEPEEVLNQQELHEQVRQSLKGMSLEDRQVLVLRYALDWSSNRIAQALDTTPAAVDMRLSRARRKIAGFLTSCTKTF